MGSLKPGIEHISYRMGVVDGAVILKLPHGGQDITMVLPRDSAIALGRNLLKLALDIPTTKKE
jgi:hypothetical protein